MKKTLAVIMTVLILLSAVLVGCEKFLPDYKEVDKTIGFMIYFSGKDNLLFPAKDLNSDSAIKIYASKVDDAYIIKKSNAEIVNIINSNLEDSNGILSQCDIEAEIYYTHTAKELQIYTEEIATKDFQQYILRNKANGNIGGGNNEFKYNFELIGKNNENYNSKIKITLKPIDVLTRLEILEFDENNKFLKSNTTFIDPITVNYSHKLSADTSYVMLNKSYTSVDGKISTHEQKIEKQELESNGNIEFYISNNYGIAYLANISLSY